QTGEAGTDKGAVPVDAPIRTAENGPRCQLLQRIRCRKSLHTGRTGQVNGPIHAESNSLRSATTQKARPDQGGAGGVELGDEPVGQSVKLPESCSFRKVQGSCRSGDIGVS